ncbi:MAG: hypothetical protein PHX52_00465 [Candidatus Pacebacteria bacterium]|nr:hypothetical protein [Candidatus Paceibacterota bacterium]MDD3919038.1 hypothetical protein [Candidatus Paceibacterota bacterium]
MSNKKIFLAVLFVIFVFVSVVVLYDGKQIEEMTNISFVGDWSAQDLLAAGTCGSSTYNVSGWAYSAVAGPISLSCRNCDLNGDSLIDNANCGNVGGAIADYGININPNKTLSGYAWTNAFGPISFNASEICASGACTSGEFPSGANNTESHVASVEYVSSGLAKVTGWARALGACDFNGTKCTKNTAGTNAGGWDGWIKFDYNTSTTFVDGGSVYNTIIKTVDSEHQIQGNAWGGDLLDTRTYPSAVIGEIRFLNSAKTTYNPNNACPDEIPVAGFSLICANGTISSASGSCYYYEGRNVTLINQTFDPDEDECSLSDGANIKESVWKVNSNTVNTSTGKANYTYILPTNIPTSLVPVALTVTNYQEFSDTETYSVYFKKGIVSDFSCCLKTETTDCSTNAEFVNCDTGLTGLTVEEGTLLYLRDSTSVPKYSVASVGASITSREWSYDKGGVNGSNTDANVPIRPGASITLTATDSLGLYDAETKSLDAMFTKIVKNPDFEEIPFD